MARLIDIYDVACLKFSIRRKGYRIVDSSFMTGLDMGMTEPHSKTVTLKRGLTYRDRAVVLRHEYTHVLGEPLVYIDEDERVMSVRMSEEQDVSIVMHCGMYGAPHLVMAAVAEQLTSALKK